jgi:hypothetical protein
MNPRAARKTSTLPIIGITIPKSSTPRNPRCSQIDNTGEAIVSQTRLATLKITASFRRKNCGIKSRIPNETKAVIPLISHFLIHLLTIPIVWRGTIKASVNSSLTALPSSPQSTLLKVVLPRHNDSCASFPYPAGSKRYRACTTRIVFLMASNEASLSEKLGLTSVGRAIKG